VQRYFGTETAERTARYHGTRERAMQDRWRVSAQGGRRRADEIVPLHERYAPRSIRFHEVWSCRGWRVKLYGSAYRRAVPRPCLVAAAKEVVGGCLPQPAATARRYGVGFMVVHEGRDSNLAFVGWWANENELYQHVWISTVVDAGSFTHVTPTGLTACVWDLAVIGFERQAWIETVLAAPGPDLDRYLRMRFEGTV
jgi:hypothetical protein